MIQEIVPDLSISNDYNIKMNHQEYNLRIRENIIAI